MRLILFLLVITLINCSPSSEQFATFEVNPVRSAFLTNGIHICEERARIADTLALVSKVEVNDKGNVSRETHPSYLLDHTDHTYYYDSLGRKIRLVSEGHVNMEYIITYELFPKKKMVIEHWMFAEDQSPYRDYIIKYNDNLALILNRIEINAVSKDTLDYLTYEYDRNQKLLGSKDDHAIRMTCDYNNSGKLTSIRKINKAGQVEIDFISPATGLVDSAFYENQEKKRVSYFKYFR